MESPVCVISPNQSNGNCTPHILLNKDCFKTDSSFSISDDNLTLEEALYNNQLSYPFFQDQKKSVRFGNIDSPAEIVPTRVNSEPQVKRSILKKHDNNHLTELFSADAGMKGGKKVSEHTFSPNTTSSAIFFNNVDSIPELDVSLQPIPIEHIANIGDHEKTTKLTTNSNSGGIKRMFSFRGKRHSKSQIIEDELNETKETLEFQRMMCKSLKDHVEELEENVRKLNLEIVSLHLNKRVMTEQIDSLGKKCEDSRNSYKIQLKKTKIVSKKVECLQRQIEIVTRGQTQLLNINTKLSNSHKQHLFCQQVAISLVDYVASIFESIIVPKMFFESDWNRLRGPYFDVDEIQKQFERLKIGEMEQLKTHLMNENSLNDDIVSVDVLLMPLWHFSGDVVKRLSVCK